LLLIAGLLSIIVKTVSAEDENFRNIAWIEGVAIFVSAFIIVILSSFYNRQRERNEENIIESEERKKSVKALRESRFKEIPYADVVVGDILKIEQGMEILADGYLIEGYDVLADESSITGESDQILKATLKESSKIKQRRLSENEKIEDYNVTTPFLVSGSKVKLVFPYFLSSIYVLMLHLLEKNKKNSFYLPI
jgi:P-type E1-E2 ATPase